MRIKLDHNKIISLSNAGLKPIEIANELNYKHSSVEKFLYKKRHPEKTKIDQKNQYEKQRIKKIEEYKDLFNFDQVLKSLMNKKTLNEISKETYPTMDYNCIYLWKKSLSEEQNNILSKYISHSKRTLRSPKINRKFKYLETNNDTILPRGNVSE